METDVPDATTIPTSSVPDKTRISATIIPDNTSTITIAGSTRNTAIVDTAEGLKSPPTWTQGLQLALGRLGRGISRVATAESFPTWVGMGVILIVDLVFIIDIELTLRLNQGLQTTGDEKQWGFGQVLAMVLLLVPMADLFRRLHPWEQIRRYHRDLQSDYRDDALRQAVNNKDFEIVRQWVEGGADPNADVDAEDGREAGFMLHAACNSGDLGIIEFLLENRANPDVKDGSGKWLLHTVSADPDVVRLLLKNGAWTNARDSRGRTLLHIACSEGNLELVQILVENRGNPRLEDREWKTPLHAACGCDEVKLDLIRLLLEHRASARAKDLEGQTALHVACGNKGITPEVILLLLEHGARPDSQDNDGRTAQALAEETHGPSSEIVRTLLQRSPSGTGVEGKV